MHMPKRRTSTLEFTGSTGILIAFKCRAWARTRSGMPCKGEHPQQCRSCIALLDRVTGIQIHWNLYVRDSHCKAIRKAQITHIFVDAAITSVGLGPLGRPQSEILAIAIHESLEIIRILSEAVRVPEEMTGADGKEIDKPSEPNQRIPRKGLCCRFGKYLSFRVPRSGI